MRVTRIIREYVEKRVKEVYGEETEIEKKYKEEKKRFEEEIEKANQDVKEYIHERMKEINNPYNFYVCTNTTYAYGTSCWSDNQHSELYNQARKAERERLTKRDNAIENIFVTLELGGNKQQLEEMLNNLK